MSLFKSKKEELAAQLAEAEAAEAAQVRADVKAAQDAEDARLLALVRPQVYLSKDTEVTKVYKIQINAAASMPSRN